MKLDFFNYCRVDRLRVANLFWLFWRKHFDQITFRMIFFLCCRRYLMRCETSVNAMECRAVVPSRRAGKDCQRFELSVTSSKTASTAPPGSRWGTMATRATTKEDQSSCQRTPSTNSPPFETWSTSKTRRTFANGTTNTASRGREGGSATARRWELTGVIWCAVVEDQRRLKSKWKRDVVVRFIGAVKSDAKSARRIETYTDACSTTNTGLGPGLLMRWNRTCPIMWTNNCAWDPQMSVLRAWSHKMAPYIEVENKPCDHDDRRGDKHFLRPRRRGISAKLLSAWCSVGNSNASKWRRR